jgi:DNA-binding IclR family transcriptional regulator
VDILNSTPDVTFLQAAADPDRHKVLQRLIEGPATQKQLAAELGLNSGTLSKHMAKLTAAGLVRRLRSHAPYELQFRSGVWQLLQANNNLNIKRARADLEAAEAQAKSVNQSGMRTADGSLESESA